MLRVLACRLASPVYFVNRTPDFGEDIALAAVLDTVERNRHPGACAPSDPDACEPGSKHVLELEQVRTLERELHDEPI
jgi:hypothetical protein